MNKTQITGLGLSSVLLAVFIVLKLTHLISWSWWWVTAPFWGWFAFVGLFFLAAFIGLFVKRYN